MKNIFKEQNEKNKFPWWKWEKLFLDNLHRELPNNMSLYEA